MHTIHKAEQSYSQPTPADHLLTEESPMEVNVVGYDDRYGWKLVSESLRETQRGETKGASGREYWSSSALSRTLLALHANMRVAVFLVCCCCCSAD